ncbi:heme lyase CcmF/NrfE family subunit [Microbulbifer flavimaris]|uniref:Heme lyase CcmF/NrfE family subunit n=1 Tax=Microbulbifer flavimaris TaxID=1781068 RepID=A0ABX4HVM7_9GAMM|nr:MULTISPECIES: heme lyase CcmF/NrfE family subunit [Microbulbifer]KUJ79217.1 cytochrome C biogenesis protein CcmF [Microbulbifer sp. ZGT114]PCO04141.1 heme lyase CcmF/NrfE family subunit [Microbulbifer flavimaris]
MIAELGHFSLLIGLLLSLTLVAVPMAGSYTARPLWMAAGRPLALGVLAFTAVAYVCLTVAFIQSDFTVAYVAHNSNSILPLHYKITAVWGGHEGSILLWLLIQAGWAAAVALFSRQLPAELVARVLSVLGVVLVGFFLFILLTSNPFDRLLPFPPVEGNDLNPLLQDPGMIIHPPLLYMGYVGFSVAFAFAIAALLGGQLDAAWARWARPWTAVAWAFLTLGIALGSWWAYYELGWGGWWFWDPVENASFMPWLVGTALMHSLAVTEKRGLFKSWTILLAIFSFSLSLLGTFLVRSGVLTSVHAFATDPLRGGFILAFLAIVVGVSLLLFALRAPAVSAGSVFSFRSRETFLLGNNILLVLMMGMVLTGTLYPLLADALNWGKISVGPPFFNLFFVPLMLVLCVLLGLGIHANWKDTRWERLLGVWQLPMAVAVVAGLALPFALGYFHWGAALGIFAGVWVTASSVADLLAKSRNANSLLAGLRRQRASYFGMHLAHIGLAVSVLGAALTTVYSVEKDVRMSPGDTHHAAGFDFRFDGVRQVQGPNYRAVEGVLFVSRDGEPVTELHPQKRNYLSGGNTMTEAAIDTGLFRDLYVALGEPMDKTNPNGDWAVRLQYKAFVVWIWLGSVLMALGGGIAVADKRYRKAKAAARTAAVAGAPAAA